MKKIFFLIIVAAVVFLWMMPSGCAVIVPPTGGPKDTLPPVFLGASPKDSSLNFKAKEVVINFDEYIGELNNASQDVIISPVPKHIPNITTHLQQLTINIKDTLEPNTTYSYNFGKSIKDVNEGNVLKGFTYVFSTGDRLDTDSITGSVRLAQTGGVDTTMYVVLYNNLSDTAVYKTQPRYYTTILDSNGRFVFRFLPKGKFHLFAVANNYMKNYSDSTDRFAFYDSIVNTEQDSLYQNLRLFAFQAYPKIEKKTTSTNTSEKQREREKEKDAKKPLTVTTNLEKGKQGLIVPLTITYGMPLKSFDSTKILLTDTNNVRIPNYTVLHDSADTTNTRFILKTVWSEDSNYRLIIPVEAAKDSFDVALAKADTIAFQAKDNHDYATVELNFDDVDTTQNPVVQIFSSDNKMLDSMRIPASRKIEIPMYEPGKYKLRVLYDKNGDMKWTPGDYKKRLQPEIVIALRDVFNFIADGENHFDVHLKAPPPPAYKPLNL